MKRNRARSSLWDRILNKVIIPESPGCWEWQGALTEKGYGIVGVGGRGEGTVRAHRAMYQLAYGVVLNEDELVCHRCDNPRCVNPSHLFVGTAADNMHDMMAKGRESPPPIRRGENVNTTRLSGRQVQEIREMELGRGDVTRVAAELGVSRNTIYRIINNQTWRHA